MLAREKARECVCAHLRVLSIFINPSAPLEELTVRAMETVVTMERMRHGDELKNVYVKPSYHVTSYLPAF